LGGRGRQISEFQDSQDYTEKPCLEKQTNKKKTKENKTKKKRALLPHKILLTFFGIKSSFYDKM
jgi:hypothetical protein